MNKQKSNNEKTVCGYTRGKLMVIGCNRTDKNSDIISVQAWRDKDVDYQKLTNNIKGEFITGSCPGGAHDGHEDWKLRVLITTPKQKVS